MSMSTPVTINAFQQTQGKAKIATDLVVEYFRNNHWEVHSYDSRRQQIAIGDYRITKDGKSYNIDPKNEEMAEKTGRLFVEKYSNWSTRRPGWLDNLDGETFYIAVLPNQKKAYIIRVKHLRELETSGKLDRYRLREQTKYVQKNDARGRAVPIEHLKKMLGNKMKEVNLNENE